LVRRNRKDTLEAISRHDVGYHSNYHSVHPSMSEYVDDLDWDSGVREWETREYSGLVDLKKAFGRDPICYGHPGSSWIPQVYPVLKKWGIPVYLDDMEIISARNERPFYFCNTLNLQGFGKNVLCLDGPPSSADLPDDHLVTLPSRFNGIIQRLETAKDTPIIGMYCHPNSYATEEFWDKVNFNRGRNPEGFKSMDEPGSLRKPKLKTPERIRSDIENLEKFLDLATSIPHLHFITASDALKIYHDRAIGRSFTRDELKNLCEKSWQSINYQVVGEEISVNAAEIYSMVLDSLSQYLRDGRLPDSVSCSHPWGPTEEFDGRGGASTFDTETFLKDCSVEATQIHKAGFMSSSVRIGDKELAPKDMFATACGLYLELLKGEKPESVTQRTGEFEVGDMITERGALADWGYYFLPENFRAPMQVKLARLQAWTLKPAIADNSVIHELVEK
jgi:hypothetical protein